MPDEFDELLDEVEDPVALKDVPGIVSGASLGPELEPAELGLEPGDLYRGYRIIRPFLSRDKRHDWLFENRGKNMGRAFYVLDERSGVVGLVPWLGSRVVWPWEQAWGQDLFHAPVNRKEKG